MRIPLGTWIRRVVITLVASLLAVQDGAAAQDVRQPDLKAAFLYNFAKFAEWPTDPAPSGPLTLCVLDDSAVESALGALVDGDTINGRTVTIARGASGARLRACHLVYLADVDPQRAAAVLDQLRGAPVLTVSTGDQFLRLGGVVGLFVEGGRMRFAINPDAAERSGVRLSSRLLQLARILKDNPDGRR